MKNSKALRLVGILLLIAIFAIIAIANTYARYTTEVNGSDTARVAHWTINTTNVVNDLFADSYTNVKSADQDGSGNVTSAVIAPGTSGSYTFTIDGDVETAYTLKIEATGTDNVNGAVAGYNPIKYSFTKPNTGDDKDTNPTVTTNDMTFSELLAAINAIDNGTTTHNAGALSGDEYTIGWSWAIDGDNAKDTELGNLVATENKTISLGVSIVATQVD